MKVSDWKKKVKDRGKNNKKMENGSTMVRVMSGIGQERTNLSSMGMVLTMTLQLRKI